MKRAPSVLLPASAKNRSPGFTAAAVHRQARHHDGLGLRGKRGVIAEKVAKSHYLPVRPALAPLFDLKFLKGIRGNHCRNFESAAMK